MAKKRARTTYATVGQMNRIDQLLAMKPPEISIMTGEEKFKQLQLEISNRGRHRILSDENVKYVYRKGGDTLHDKSCKHVDGIANHNLRVSDKYMPAKRQCPDCAIKAYIRAGGNVADKNDYMSFFERVGLDENMIRHIYIVMKAKTSIFMNVLSIEVRGEKWKIKALDGKDMHVDLLHSNFEVKNNERIDFDGYHSVKTNISIKEALNVMQNYSWQEHATKIKLTEKLETVKLKKQAIIQAIRHKFLALLGVGKLGTKRTIYYVDGDNCPGERIKGIEDLGSRDIVKIFHAKNNTYYLSARKRRALKESSKSKVLLIPINPGPDAVDFAIGMDAYAECMKNPMCHMYLISRDKHFGVIKEQIDSLTNNKAIVTHVETVGEAKWHDDQRIYNRMWDCWNDVQVQEV